MKKRASASAVRGNAIWGSEPATGEWNTAANWDPAVVPADTASFDKSSWTEITFSPKIQATVYSIKFAAGAPSYMFTFDTSDVTAALTIAGKGITNDSGKTQSFRVAARGVSYKNPKLKFTNSATAGGHEMSYYAGPECLRKGYGGGIIGFCDKSTAGSASFTVATGAVPPPKKGSTVGGEVSFSDSSSAANARFTIYGTLGSDGDTFGNVVFHDTSTADSATFTNVGGTVSGGDGGNTQFYDNSTAAGGVYHNYGGTHSKANGGDVAFDGAANGGHGHFYNYAAPAAGAYGGVTSFNNNPPRMKAQGASAGCGYYHNYGVGKSDRGGGGHTEFSARYGSPTAANGTFVNYGSVRGESSSAGHTIFSISLPAAYFPTAGNGTFWNHPAAGKAGAAGFTEFTEFTEFKVYGKGAPKGSKVPTAGDGTFHNLGGSKSGAAGGYTSFGYTSSAGNALLIAYGGTHGGEGGQIVFSGASAGGKARVQLFGNGSLDISGHRGGLSIGALELTGGVIKTQLGKASHLTGLTLSGKLILKSTRVTFSFSTKDGGEFAFNKLYTILTASNLSSFSADQFAGNSLGSDDGENEAPPTFSIVGKELRVSFNR